MIKNKKFNTVYLHFGSDKTGSTTLQEHLDKNRSKNIERYNLYYAPERWHPFLASYMSGSDLNFGFNVETDQNNKEIVVNRDNQYIDKLKKSISLAENNSVYVISFEGFHQLSEESMKNLKVFFENYTDDLKVIYYLRPPVSYAVSAISQCIRTGRRIGDHPPVQPYKRYINKFINVFGDKNLILKKFERKLLFKNDIVCDFYNLLGLDLDVSSGGIGENESLSAPASMVGNVVIKKFESDIAGTGMSIYQFGRFLDPILQKIKGSKLKLTPAQFDSVKNRSEENNLYLNDFFDEVFHDFNEYSAYSKEEVEVMNNPIFKDVITELSDRVFEEVQNKIEKV